MGCAKAKAYQVIEPNRTSATYPTQIRKYHRDIREYYTIKHSITFNSSTGLFQGQMLNDPKAPVLIRYAKLNEDKAEKVTRLIEYIKANQQYFPQLIPYVDIIHTDNYIYLVMNDNICIQPILAAIIAGRYPLSEVSLCIAIGQICNTLSNMHNYRVVHGQLSPHKILLINGNCFIFDVSLGIETASDRIAENYKFMAPEVLNGEIPSYESDVWSLGAIIYFFITGHTVYYGGNSIEYMQASRVSQANFYDSVWDTLSPSLKDLVVKMLEKDKTKRIKMQEVAASHWIQGIEAGLNSVQFINGELFAQDIGIMVCIQKALYVVANERSKKAIKELQENIRSHDPQNTGWIELGTLVEKSIGASSSLYEISKPYKNEPVHYANFIYDALVLNQLIQNERISVLFYQLSKAQKWIYEPDIKKVLGSVMHTSYADNSAFLKDLINQHTRYPRSVLALEYEEFVGLCEDLDFFPSEALIVGKFFEEQ